MTTDLVGQKTFLNLRQLSLLHSNYPALLMKTCRLIVAVLLFNVGLSGASEISKAQEKMSADSSIANKKAGTLTLSGNARYADQNLQLAAHKITMFDDKKSPARLEVTGNPLSLLQNTSEYALNANTEALTYHPEQQQVSLATNTLLQLDLTEGEKVIIAAELIDYHFDNSQSLSPLNLTASGTPVKLNLIELDGSEIEASSESIHYTSSNGIITMEKNISFRYQGNLVRAEKLIYNLIDKTWEVPKVENKRFEIIKNSLR